MCQECGWVRTTAQQTETAGVICTNPQCGAANSANERLCQRCLAPLPWPEGKILHGRYRIEQHIAVGGFGSVYRAYDLEARRVVALKEMFCADAAEFATRLGFFRREAEILRLLQPFVIVPRLYDFVHQGTEALIVMEFVRGRNLLEVLESGRVQAFPIPVVARWGIQICQVLEHLHAQKPPIIHRDIKPDNLMLLDDETSIRMIDFGTARDLGRSVRTRLAAKTRVFTEGYAPPEQILGKPEVRSDLFALAGTLYHLATGKPPEGPETGRHLAEQLQSRACPFASHERWFYEILQINLSEDANDRYYSAHALRQDLEKQHVTRQVNCPRCAYVNRVREPYCVRCGTPLTEPGPPCTACGRENYLGSRFCVHCGSRLR